MMDETNTEEARWRLSRYAPPEPTEGTEPETRDINGCAFAGPGRGDCEHFIGYPSPIHKPKLHDGPDTEDVYGKPNGWCWSCWKSRQIQRLREQLAATLAKVKE